MSDMQEAEGQGTSQSVVLFPAAQPGSFFQVRRLEPKVREPATHQHLGGDKSLGERGDGAKTAQNTG